MPSQKRSTELGNSGRMPVASAVAWINGQLGTLGSEEVARAQAVGRVLAESIIASTDLPAKDTAAIDGLALRAEETAGASPYSPLPFGATAPGAAILPGGAAAIGAGAALPTGADAVVPDTHVERRSASFEVIEAAAAGSGVERRASQWARGETLLGAGRLLGPWEIGLLAAAGVSRTRVVRRPRVRCLCLTRAASGAPTDDGPDAPSGLLLRALIERDGGTLTEAAVVQREQQSLREALLAAPADLVISVGGTGSGSDDHAAQALIDAGHLAAHGVALSPGETAGFGQLASGVPVFLLPGTPVACLWAYELLAGPALRRLGGRSLALPFATRRLVTSAKIVSSIGMTEIWPVRVGGQHATPIASFAAAGLGALARADGFVIVDPGSEGYPQGTSVTVYLRDPQAHTPASEADGDPA